MSKSDIFNKYAELALEKGLISNADSKEKLESGTGADSLNISDIEVLYGVKPNSLKGMEYKRNIVENAHPNAAVVSPSYDKLNGLVENLNERQDIMLNIVNKPVNGHHTQKKYAADELMLSLVSIANHMDNINNDELRVLADACVEQLGRKKQANPLAILAPLFTPMGMAGVAAVGGLIYWAQHSPEVNKGFRRNAENLIKQLDDLITSGTGMFSLRTEYSDAFKNQMKEVRNKVSDLLKIHSKVEKIVEEIEAPKAADSLAHNIQAAHIISNNPSYIDTYDSFKDEVKKIEPMLATIKKNFNNESYKARQVKGDEGLFSKINDMFGGVMYGGKKSLISDEFNDVLLTLESFTESVKEVGDILYKAKDSENMNKSKLEDVKPQMASYDRHDQSHKKEKSKSTFEDLNTEDLEKTLNELGIST